MMKQNPLRCIALLFAFLLLLPLCIGCGDTATEKTTTVPTAQTEAPDPNAYVYPDVDYNKETFTIMGCEDKYEMITNVLADEQNGVDVNDAQYAMTVFLEEKLNIDLVEERIGYHSEMDTLTPIVASNDPHYDLVYLQIKNVGSMFTSNYLMNMYDMPGLQLDSAWWDQGIREEASILGDQLYFLVSDVNLMSFDGTWCMYFNKKMFEDRNIPFPYQTVKDQAWTLDELYTLCHTYATDNGEGSVGVFDPNGNAIYGMATQINCMSAFLTGCNELYCKLDADKRPYFAMAESATLADANDKICRLTSATRDATFLRTPQGAEISYKDVFVAERALLMGGEVADSRKMSEMKSEYGILPMPKATTDQENYVSHMLTEALYLAVPTSCGDLERAAVVMDSLSYYASANILPKYYNSVCYRGLHDTDSVAMLEIIHETRYLNWGLGYGWLDSAVSTVVNMLDSGGTGLASKVTSLKRSVDALISRTMQAYE